MKDLHDERRDGNGVFSLFDIQMNSIAVERFMSMIANGTNLTTVILEKYKIREKECGFPKRSVRFK